MCERKKMCGRCKHYKENKCQKGHQRTIGDEEYIYYIPQFDNKGNEKKAIRKRVEKMFQVPRQFQSKMEIVKVSREIEVQYTTNPRKEDCFEWREKV